MTWLSPEEWTRFNELLEKKEGTTYFDVLECLIMCLPGKIQDEVRAKKPSITDLAFLIQKHQAGELKA